MDNDRFQLSAGDRAKEGARAVTLGAAGALPIVGPMLTELLDVMLPRVFERRVTAFIQRLEARVGHLELTANETTATVFAIAAQAALTSDDAKIEYLANAVANAAKDDEWQHDTASILLRLVADLTATHMRVLDLLVDPSGWIAMNNVLLQEQTVNGAPSLAATLSLAFETSGSQIGDMELVLGDLEAHGLLGDATADGGTFPQGLRISAENVTELGRRVHSFVTWDG